MHITRCRQWDALVLFYRCRHAVWKGVRLALEITVTDRLVTSANVSLVPIINYAISKAVQSLPVFSAISSAGYRMRMSSTILVLVTHRVGSTEALQETGFPLLLPVIARMLPGVLRSGVKPREITMSWQHTQCT